MEKVQAFNRKAKKDKSGKPVKARPSWEEYFFKITLEVASRSTCLRRQTGAIVIRDKRILSTGYNGAPSGLMHCSEAGCLREDKKIASGERHELCRGLHAEQNAIIQAARHGIDISQSTIFCTHHPCVLCAKMLINAGIGAVYYIEGYPDDLAKDMLSQAGLKVVQSQ